jgi:hypothetical protein
MLAEKIGSSALVSMTASAPSGMGTTGGHGKMAENDCF